MNYDTLKVQLSRLLWLIFGIIEAMLGFRIFLKLIGANPSADFTSWIYQTSGWLLDPFRQIAPTPQFAGGALDLPAIIALMVYVVLSWIVLQIIAIVIPPQTGQQSASQV